MVLKDGLTTCSLYVELFINEYYMQIALSNDIKHSYQPYIVLITQTEVLSWSLNRLKMTVVTNSLLWTMFQKCGSTFPHKFHTYDMNLNLCCVFSLNYFPFNGSSNVFIDQIILWNTLSIQWTFQHHLPFHCTSINCLNYINEILFVLKTSHKFCMVWSSVIKINI